MCPQGHCRVVLACGGWEAAPWLPDSVLRSQAHPFRVHTTSCCPAAGGFPSHHPK